MGGIERADSIGDRGDGHHGTAGEQKRIAGVDRHPNYPLAAFGAV
jgi:hypothetical protein